MYTHYVKWDQNKSWKKEFPPEMVFLFDIAWPARETSDGIYWNWFGAPTRIQINIYDEETIVAFKLKFPK